MRALILGATSAIAAETALLYAGRGDRLHLVGRNRDKLTAITARCGGVGATMQQADFARLEDNAAVIEQAIATLGGIDTVLLAPGDLGDQLASEQSFAEAERILRINLLSVVAL